MAGADSSPLPRHDVVPRAFLMVAVPVLSVIVACRDNPRIRVTSPAEGAFVTGPSVTVAGTAQDVPLSAAILVNGVPATRPGVNAWSADVPVDLVAVHNRIVVQLVMP